MATDEAAPGKTDVVDNSIFKLVVQTATPALLGALLTVAIGISASQKEQGNQLAELKGQIGVMSQQYTDIGGRLSKVETGVDDNRRAIGEIKGRVMVLENQRHQ